MAKSKPRVKYADYVLVTLNKVGGTTCANGPNHLYVWVDGGYYPDPDNGDFIDGSLLPLAAINKGGPQVEVVDWELWIDYTNTNDSTCGMCGDFTKRRWHGDKTSPCGDYGDANNLATVVCLPLSSNLIGL